MKELENKILSILELLYGPCDRQKCFLAKDRKENDIRQEIVDKFSEASISNSNLDVYVVITQMNTDVFIRVQI